MEENRRNDIERGMQLAASLPDIMPDQASERIYPIYEDIKDTLRVPIVNLIFRTLANYPDYLIAIWSQLSPNLRTFHFEQEADTLRQNSLLEPAPTLSGVEWHKLGQMDEVRAFNDTIHYVLPKLIITTAAFYKMTFGSDDAVDQLNSKSSDSLEFPVGPAQGTTKVEMIDPEGASEKVQELFKSIKERHGHPLVSSYYRGLANWPDFLEEVWKRLGTVVGSPDYEERKRKLVEKAEELARSLKLNKLKGEVLNEEQSSEVRAILTAFHSKFIPEMMLDAALIKAMIDGPSEAAFSHFSAK